MINVNNTNSSELENVVVDGQLCLSASKRQPVWVAEIVGTHPVYKLDRKFINEDESGAGWKAWNLEENKIYCINPSANKKDQYFVVLVDGTLNELTKGQVEEMVK